MFKRKKKKTGCETPELRKYTPPPMPPVRPPKPPTSGSNAVQPSPPCTYSTSCGWCAKWDKKCDKKIGRDKQSSEIDFTQLLDDEGDPMKAEAIRQWNEVYKKARKMMDDK